MNGAAFGLQDRLSEVRRRHPRFHITFDKARQVWRADRKDHVIVQYTFDDLERALDQENPMKDVDQ
jgi:hypothetical protein